MANEATGSQSNMQGLVTEVENAYQLILHERNRLAAISKQFGLYAPGHFSSTIPSLQDLQAYKENLKKPVPESLPDIELNVPRQLELLKAFSEFIPDLPFPETKTEPYRYYYQNMYYSYSDAIFLHCMMRLLKPKRMIEIGSGFSSCAILDTNEFFFDNAIDCDFIEPYPERLLENMKPLDLEKHYLYVQTLQDTDISLFEKLEANDILFVDSSHVSKVNSDVNRILFEILPILKPGVYIHFHDIFYPFEYTEDVFDMGAYWNECYILRAFLANNKAYEMQLFSDYIRRFHLDAMAAVSPLCLKVTGGNLWLKKL